MHVGDMPRETAMYNIDLFATSKVLPGLREVFPKDRHRWWPQPIDGFEMSQPGCA